MGILIIVTRYLSYLIVVNGVKDPPPLKTPLKIVRSLRRHRWGIYNRRKRIKDKIFSKGIHGFNKARRCANIQSKFIDRCRRVYPYE